MVRATQRTRVRVHRAEEREAGAGHPACQLRGTHGLDDAARVDEVVRRRELLDRIQEERALLGEEERRTRVEAQLARIRLDLREIRVDGTVQVEVVRDAPPRVATELRPARVEAITGSQCGPSGSALRDLRIDVHHQAAMQVRESFQRPGLRKKRQSRASGRRPAVLMSGVLHEAHDVESPDLLRRRLVAEALEGNAHFDDVSLGRHLSLRREHEVGIHVHGFARQAGATKSATPALARLENGAVGLDTERIHGEHGGLPAVVEGAQEDLDVVVGRDLVAVGEGRARRTVPLECANAEMNRGRGIPDEHFRRVVRGGAVVGRELAESGEQRRLRPLCLVESPVHHHRALIQPRRPHLHLIGAAVVDRSRRRRIRGGDPP